jgi:hypothetical protein
LEDLTNQEAEQSTIDDLFNTLVAGFKLANDNKVTTLNTGGGGIPEQPKGCLRDAEAGRHAGGH